MKGKMETERVVDAERALLKKKAMQREFVDKNGYPCFVLAALISHFGGT